MRLTLSGVVTSVVIGCASPAAAQMISGRVLMPDSVTPAAGIVVTVMTPDGASIARALSGSRGEYSVPLGRAGAYDVRALRIGFRPTVVRVVAAPGESVRRDIVITSLPVAIAGISIAGHADCDLKGRDARTFLSLWEQARAALAATSLSEQAGALDVEMVRMNGHIDHVTPGSVFGDSLYPVQDTARIRQLALSRAFASTPPETLETAGYVRPGRDGTPVFDMPNPEALLSDGFMAAHCFSIARSGDYEDWVGLRFEPRRRTTTVVDIAGTLWLDTATFELRRIEFKYANLPDAAYHICDSIAVSPVRGELLLDDPPFAQPKPGCYSQRNGRSNQLNLGGSADLTRLATGEWLITKWFLRTPPDSSRFRPALRRCRAGISPCEPCWYGPKCPRVSAMRARLVTVTGVTTRVIRDGVELYRDTSANSLIDAMVRKRAGDHPATLVGVVVDQDRRPVSGAIIQTEEPWRTARTDGQGVFRLTALPAGDLVVSVRCAGYVSRRVRLTLVKDSTHRIRIDFQPDTVGVRGAGCAQR